MISFFLCTFEMFNSSTYISIALKVMTQIQKNKINAGNTKNAKKTLYKWMCFYKIAQKAGNRNMYFTLPLSVAAAPTAVVAIVRDPVTADAKTIV